MPHPLPLKRVECSYFDEGLNGGFADRLWTHSCAKIGQSSEGTPFCACLENGTNGAFTNAFDGKQPKADISLLHGEAPLTSIDIGTKHPHPHFVSLSNKNGDLLGVTGI